MNGDAVDRLHPAVLHHLVNTLGWRSLRQLQKRAIEPLLAGDHALLGAPTAAGKTEAALLPLLSRMASENWSGVSILYVCPLRALLNNLEPRISRYCELLGRRAAVWHGDVDAARRRRILADPPDVLLTTPESIEAMFLSVRVDAPLLLERLRVVVVDEIHAFAGDDRGWHLVALLARLDELRLGRDMGAADAPAHPSAGHQSIQRVGLSATVGNPDQLLAWLCTGADGPRSVVMAEGTASVPPELTIDWVGSLENAAEVISRLHRGEKRLAFADSRARVEQLAAALRARGVSTFVSHSSLAADERRSAERAFAESRDCVIVATSTLELGIDVGDLDRVLQIGAPRTVASVVQRLGRTGRRAGAARNCLFLATTDSELLQAFGLVRLLREGWVEDLRAPAFPVHLAAQQLLARVLSARRIGRSDWPGVFEPVAAAAGLDGDVLDGLVTHMLAREILLELDGTLQIGVEGERLFGRRHFMDLTSMFLSEPLMSVRWGQRGLGQVDASSLLSREGDRPTILLAGSAWGVRAVDWTRRLVWVEPSEEPGRSRWNGSGGALSVELCHAIRSVLSDRIAPACATRRGSVQLASQQEQFWFARDGATSLQRSNGRRTRWWTFAGGRGNAELARRLAARSVAVASFDDLGITLSGLHSRDQVRDAASAPAGGLAVDERRLSAIKFYEAVPRERVHDMLSLRDSDADAVRAVLAEDLDLVE
jgi:ATP-dependent Lhr-like helicase